MATLRDKKAPLPQFSSTRDRPRIVVENVDGAQRFIEHRILEGAGYEVVTCGGPEELANHRCPLAEGDDCPAIKEADVVVSSFTAEGSEGAAIIRGIRRRYPSTPLIVEAPPAVQERHSEVLAGCHVIYPLTRERLLSSVRVILGADRAISDAT